jgi:NADPH-dependent curcumin reductase CurA
MTVIPAHCRRVVLVNRPPGEPAESGFRIEDVPMPGPRHGEVRVKVAYLSLDPTGARSRWVAG